jgi:RNA polymerase sigma-70 factor (ECF subfamily)
VEALALHVPTQQRAWTAIHRTYYPVAVAFLRKLGVRGDHVEDVCQEVFLQMHRYLPTFRGESDLKTWMYRICISEARRHRRRERLASLVSSVLGARPSEATSTGLELDPESAARRVLKGLDALPERRRTILVLCDMDGLCGAEIADIMNCSVQSVWRELHHARSAFLAAFGGAEPGASS